MSESFGRKLKNARLDQDLMLREYCLANNFDAIYVSKVERGVIMPHNPAELVEALGIQRYRKELGARLRNDQYTEFALALMRGIEKDKGGEKE